MDAVIQGLTLLMDPFNIFLIFIAVLIDSAFIDLTTYTGAPT